MGSYRICMCFTRKFRVTEAEPPEDVREAFRKYADGNSHMSSEGLRRFLVEVQGEPEDALSAADSDAVLQQILQKRHHITRLARHSLTLDDFHHYLFSADLNPPIADKVHQDMTAPLSHYFIYTGHNSYLTGNQLTSVCSDVPIIKALKKGVRVIELDIWPNSTKDGVHVLHGGTVTAPVELIACLRSIKEHAFSASPYPVIITLEDHLTPDLQAKVAEMLSQTFGEILFTPESAVLDEFPSPEDLKYRIIISTKPPKEYLEAQANKDGRTDGLARTDSEDPWGNEPSCLTAEHDEDEEDEEEEEDKKVMHQENDLEDSKIHETLEYRYLIAIHAGKPKGGIEAALKVEPGKVRRLSLSEQALEKAARSHGTDIVRFTQKNILRVYPRGTRFNSSNFKPQIGWLHGAQMVAFNMQGYGRSLWLMQGMFRGNGGCGFVKKPDFLMNASDVFDPKAKLHVKRTLKVKVYMGDGWHMDFKPTHFDLYSPPDFYTVVGIAGAPGDEAMKKTKKKEDNWTPVWDEEFAFPLSVPEVALLRIEVHEYDMTEKDDFAGQICLPVSELRSGIRAVPLCDRKGERLKSVRLLVRFDI
ncbi:hypothetical protein M569_13801, partial [Genlisea aurea]